MKKLTLAIGTIFLFFNIMALSGFANYPLIITPNKCEFVSVSGQGVILEAGESAMMYITVRNNSDWPFYLNDASFKPSNKTITAESLTSNLVIGSGQTGLVKATITARSGSSNQTTQVAVQITGNLQNGQYCDSQSIEALLVPVMIQSRTVSDECSLSELVVPEPITYTPGKDVTINVAFKNDLDRSAILKAHHNSAVISPQTVGLSAHQAGNVAFTVSSLNNDQSFAFFDLEQSGCETKSYLVLLRPRDQNQPVVVPPITPSTTQLEMDGNVTLQTTDGSYRVEVTVRNPGTSSVNGFLGLSIPDNWTTQNPQSVSLTAGQTKTVSFNVKPNVAPSKTNVGQVVFTFSNGLTQTKNITFPLSTGLVGLAFAFLGGNLIWLGLLLIFLLLVVLLGLRRSRMTRETTLITTSNEPAKTDVSENSESDDDSESTASLTTAGEPHNWKDGRHPTLPETHVTTKEAKGLNEDPTASTDFEKWLDHQVSQLRD